MATSSLRDWDRIILIHKKTDGRCHLCGHRHAAEDYGLTWELEHSRPKAWGGSDHLNNLFAGCISCNRSKGTQSSRSFRRNTGLRRTPLSAAKNFEKRLEQALILSAGGAFAGRLLHPKGFWKGATIGFLAGFSINPEWNNGL